MASTEEAKLLELLKLLPDWQSATNSSSKLAEVWQNASIVSWMQQHQNQIRQNEQSILQRHLTSGKYLDTTPNGISSTALSDSAVSKIFQNPTPTSQFQVAASLVSPTHTYSSFMKAEQQSNVFLKAVSEQLQTLQQSIIAPKAIHVKPGYFAESGSRSQNQITSNATENIDAIPSTANSINMQDQYSPAATSEDSSQLIDSKIRKQNCDAFLSNVCLNVRDNSSASELHNHDNSSVPQFNEFWRKDTSVTESLEENVVVAQPLLKSILDLVSRYLLLEADERKELTSATEASESRSTVLVRCADFEKSTSTVPLLLNSVSNEPSSSCANDCSTSAGSALKTAKNGGFDKLHCSQYSFNDNNAEKSDKLPSVLVEENTLCQNNREVLTSAPNSSANPTSSATSCTVSSHTTSSPPFLHSSSPQLEAASNTTRSTFCRAPGLGPVSIPEGHPGTQHPLVCQICGFSCNSKFHYNSHMNTHGDHQCTMCDYTSRTEGRLKKHMRDSHTVEQQIAAGLEIDSSQRSVTPSNLKKSSSQSLSTSVASLLENASSLAVGASAVQSATSPGNSPSSVTNSSPNSLEKCVNGPVTDDSSPNDSIISLQREEPSTSGVNSERRSSKPKNYKCKQCNQVSTSKEEQWIHARSHIPAEKRLECNRCGFVTEYKHHLEYHLRNHVGSKPFQCRKCAYSCVNKSMLNSHMKSHTNIYQFRCRDCSYATKYCHSLKLHLKKYNHNRAGDSNDGGGIDASCDSVDGDDSEVRRLSESYSVNDEEDGTSSPQDSIQQNVSSSSGTTPVVTSSSLNLSQLLLQHQQSGQIDPVNVLNAAFRMNALQSISTAGSVLPPHCHFCSYQPSSVDEGLRHQMMHIITGHNDLISSSVPTSSGAISKELKTNKAGDDKFREKINNSSQENEDLENGHSTAKMALTENDAAELMNDDTDRSCENPDSNESEKNSGDELSSSADENGERKSRKRKAGLKLNEIAARLQEKKTPDESANELVSSEAKKERRNENSSNKDIPSALASGLSLPVPIAPLSSSRFLPSVGQSTNNLNAFQQFANMQSQQFEVLGEASRNFDPLEILMWSLQSGLPRANVVANTSGLSWF